MILLIRGHKAGTIVALVLAIVSLGASFVLPLLASALC